MWYTDLPWAEALLKEPHTSSRQTAKCHKFTEVKTEMDSLIKSTFSEDHHQLQLYPCRNRSQISKIEFEAQQDDLTDTKNQSHRKNLMVTPLDWLFSARSLVLEPNYYFLLASISSIIFSTWTIFFFIREIKTSGKHYQETNTFTEQVKIQQVILKNNGDYVFFPQKRTYCWSF